MGKKMMGWMLLMSMLLCGCGSVETFETISDVPAGGTPAEHRAISVSLPKNAASPVMENGEGQLYLCDDYEIALQTMEAGDLNRTVETVSGYEKEELTLLQTQLDGTVRHDFVWTAAGENGQQIVRAAILDDGNYHYVLTAQCAAEDAGVVRTEWDGIFSSFKLD